MPGNDNTGDVGSTPGPGTSHMPRATKPGHHSYSAWALPQEPMLCNEGETLQWAAPYHRERKSKHRSDDPAQPQVNRFFSKRYLKKIFSGNSDVQLPLETSQEKVVYIK